METKVSLQQLDKEIIELLNKIDNFKQYVDDRIQQLIGTSPENLDTIYELAEAINNNEDAIDILDEAITKKVDKEEGKELSSNDLTDDMVQRWDAKSDFSGSYKDLKDVPDIDNGTPIGEVIAYMGVSAPDGYLICNGVEYNISDYPYLVQHFIDNFGSANYFGGDGITTFSVPDLRGEFLRGTGTASRNTGSGANVGIHQNPTKHVNIGYNINEPSFWVDGAVFKNGTKTNAMVDGDIYIKSNSTVGRAVNLTNWNGAAGYVQATSRPTNTSVLYCIKYKKISSQQDNIIEEPVNMVKNLKNNFNIAR